MGEQDAVVGLDPSVADDNMDTKAGDETETARDESEGMEEQDAQEEVQSKQEDVERRLENGIKVPSTAEMTKQDILNGLSQLGRTATGERTTYLRLELSGKPASDCSAIAKFKHLQIVTIQDAGLTSLAGLESLPYLTNLDVSGNRLTEFPGFALSGRLLRTATYARNSVASFGDVHQLCLLEDLDLSSNAITSLDALRPMPCLARLDLSRNSVEDCSPLHPMSGTLRDLSLAHNALHVPDSLAPLSALTRLDVSGNHFRSVDAIGALTLLRELDLSSNALPCPESLVSLTTLALLRSLSIAGNPLCDFEVVDRHVFYLLPQITVQDNQEVDPRDKVHAANTRGLDIPALAAIRERLLPNGELADYGGTSAPLCVTLEAASDCGEWGAGVDAHAAACTVATMRKGITAVCEYLVEACETDLDIVRAAYVWLLEVLEPPPGGDMWRPGLPLFKNKYREAESALSDSKGAWAERVSSLFALILLQFHIPGYIKPLGSIPGTKLRLPNHAWNAVDIKGKWRLLDPAWASNPEAQLAFYTPPSEFVFTHLPLTQRWQLLGDPISVEDFWALPQLAPAFFPLGVAIPEEVPSLCETGTASLRLPMPRDTVPFPQLLELPGMEEVTPHPPGTKGVPPGSFVFAEVGAEASGEELTQWDITARLPEPSKDYCIRVVASRGSDPAVEIMMVRVSSPASGLDVGKVLPNYHDQWLRSRCRLLSPRPQEVLSPGQVVSFRIVVPGAVGGVAVGEPGGYQFELLERKDGDTYVGTVKVPENAVSLVVTTHSVENEGIYMPLLKWHLKSGMHSPFHSRATSPVRSSHPNGQSRATSPIRSSHPNSRDR